jgi:hypothetical protein
MGVVRGEGRREKSELKIKKQLAKISVGGRKNKVEGAIKQRQRQRRRRKRN